MHGNVDTLRDEEFSNYICDGCETIFEEFHLKCPSCGKPGSVQKIEITPKLYDDDFGLFNDAEMEFIEPVPASAVATPAAVTHEISPSRLVTGFRQFDELFGGGIFGGSVNLFIGRPGSGKTAFLLKIAELYSRSGHPVLFISSEESFGQMSGNIRKFSISSPKLYFVSMMELGASIREIDRFKPEIVVIDSISAFFKKEVEAIQSSHVQIQECLAALSREAKDRNIAMLISAQNLYPSCVHEYESLAVMTDSIFTLDKMHSNIMILRTRKNRCVDALPSLVFHCDSSSVLPVTDSRIGIRCEGVGEPLVVGNIGEVPFSHIEGGTVFFNALEVLVGPKRSSSPKWAIGSGICRDAFEAVAAVVEKYENIKLSDMNICARLKSSVGVTDRALDLAAAAAIISSFDNIAIPGNFIFSGKVLLSGNVEAPDEVERHLDAAAGRGYVNFLTSDGGKNTARKYTEAMNITNINNIKCIRRALSDKVLKRP